MSKDLKKYQDFLSAKKAEKSVLSEQKNAVQSNLLDLNSSKFALEEAQEILNVTAVIAQDQFKEVVEKLVTEALQYIFGPSYAFEVDSKISRNRSEARFYVLVDGKRRSLDKNKVKLGGGVLDLVSFALRLAFWAIQIRPTSPVIILDEPLKFLSKDKMEFLGLMLHTLTELLNLQLILISHESDLIELADISYHVQMRNGESMVERVI